MGIFSRFRDIVSSNINSMLDKAEDPEKLIRLMIQEMEDTLVDMKASCAGSMASRSKVLRSLEEARSRADIWDSKAKLALEKGREDLAREALLEKRSHLGEVGTLESEALHFDSMIEQYQKDIEQLEEKLAGARKKHRLLVQRHIRAQRTKKAQSQIREADSVDAAVRFDHLENRIERMEGEADLVNYGHKPTLEDDFSRLEKDQEIERELELLKQSLATKDDEKAAQKG